MAGVRGTELPSLASQVRLGSPRTLIGIRSWRAYRTNPDQIVRTYRGKIFNSESAVHRMVRVVSN